MKKFFLIISLLACNNVWAEYSERGALCYMLDNKEKVIDKTACLVTLKDSNNNMDSTKTYNIKGNKFIEKSDMEESSFSAIKNGKFYKSIPFSVYVRDGNFRKTNDWNNYVYYCYKSNIVHFCEK